MPSSFVGRIGERVELELLLDSLRSFPGGEYGTRTLCRFHDTAGRIVVWWASTPPFAPRELGGTFRIRGTVRSLETWDGYPRTVLTRCVVLERRVAA